jgi:hypothetical protein
MLSPAAVLATGAHQRGVGETRGRTVLDVTKGFAWWAGVSEKADELGGMCYPVV